MKNHILCADTRRELAVDLNSHVLTSLCDQSLRGKNVLYLRRTNAESQSSKRSMGRCVAVTTDDCGAGERETLLGTNNVYNALSLVAQAKISDAEILDVVFESHALQAGVLFFDEGLDVF
jgi:microcompartment protein CcmK/EutM